MWEGGCRVPAFITGPHINGTGVSSALVILGISVVIPIIIISIVVIVKNGISVFSVW